MYIVLYTKKLLNSLDTKEEDYFFFFITVSDIPRDMSSIDSPYSLYWQCKQYQPHPPAEHTNVFPWCENVSVSVNHLLLHGRDGLEQWALCFVSITGCVQFGV